MCVGPPSPLLELRALALMMAVGLGFAATACTTSIESDAGASVTTAVGVATTIPFVTNPSGDTSAPPSEAMPVNLVGGGMLDLAAYSDRPLLLWFWAPF
jgi:hypothetical protein